MTIRVPCPECGRWKPAPDQWAGKVVQCHDCGAKFEIPEKSVEPEAAPQEPVAGSHPPAPQSDTPAPPSDAPVSPPPPRPSEQEIGVSLPAECEACGKTYLVPPDWAGKRVACPHCEGAIEVPIPLTEADLTPATQTPVEPQPAADPFSKLAQEDLTAGPAVPAPAGDPFAPTSPFAPGRATSSRVAQPRKRPSKTAPFSGFELSGKNPLVALALRNKLVTAVLGIGLLCCIGLLVGFLGGWGGDGQRSPAESATATSGSPGELFPVSDVPLPDFPTRGSPGRLVEGVEMAEVRLGVRSGQPGQAGLLWVYTPPGTHAPRSLPCVLIAPAGSNLLSGMRLGDGDRPEHLPYVRAGFAVVAFELDGPLRDPDSPTDAEIRRAYQAFSAAQAGLVNARNALEFVLQRMSEVDPDRIYVAGHSSAATLALLFAEHEPRIKACVAYAPAVDALGRMSEMADELADFLPGSIEFLKRSSPINQAEHLDCPLFLFHAHDDSNVSVQESIGFADKLRSLGKAVTLVTVPRGDHYDSMIREGIPRAIEWLRGWNVDRLRVSPPPVAAGAPDAFSGPPPTMDVADLPSTSPSSLDEPPESAAGLSEPSLAGDGWSVQPDPPADEIRVPQDLSIPMPFEVRVFGTNFFPALPSRFVALGHNGNDMGVMTVWNLETVEQAGTTLSGKLGMGSRLLALSPDGRFLAGERDRKAAPEGEGAYLSIWSFETGKHVRDLEVSRESPFVDYFQFAAPDRLVTALRPPDKAYEVRIWSVPDGQLQREVSLDAEDRHANNMALSPSGRYLAAATDRLVIYDLTSGRLAGAVPFPGVKGSDEWKCRGLTFSHDGTELAGLFDAGGSTKIVGWDLSDGSVVVHHTEPGNWHSRVARFRNYDGDKIQWLADKSGWLVAGCTAIERESGKAAWQREDVSSEPVCLLNGQQLVGLAGGGPPKTLVACDVSLSQAPDLEHHPGATPPSPFPGTPGLEGVVRVQVLDYPDSGDPVTVAQEALRGISWANASAVKVDQQRKEILIGAGVMTADTDEAKAALEQAGFKIGASMLRSLE